MSRRDGRQLLFKWVPQKGDLFFPRVVDNSEKGVSLSHTGQARGCEQLEFEFIPLEFASGEDG